MKLFLKFYLFFAIFLLSSNICISQSNSEQFLKFWDEFKTSVINDDTSKLIQMSDFPMTYFFSEFVKWNEEDFRMNFERMFGYKDIFLKAEFAKKILFSEDEDGKYILSLIEDPEKPGGYFLRYEFIARDDEFSFEITYHFEIVNGVYKFKKYIEAD